MTKILCVITDHKIIPYYYDKTGQKIRALVSYFYGEKNIYPLACEYKGEMIEELYLDCGAYSAYKGNISLSFSEYAKYIQMFGHYFDHCFNLDDDFLNPEHNFNNQVLIEKGLCEEIRRPIPVIHDSEDPIGEIEIYVDQGHDYIAVGSNKKLDDDTWSAIKDKYPDLKLHMFGNLNRKMLFNHKPYSADSADWAHRSKYGCIYYYDPEDDEEYSIYLGEKDRPDEKRIYFSKFHHKKDLEDYLDNMFGFGYEDLLQEKRNQWVVNLHYFRELENRINYSR